MKARKAGRSLVDGEYVSKDQGPWRVGGGKVKNCEAMKELSCQMTKRG